MAFILEDEDGMIAIDTGNGIKIPVNILIGDSIFEDWESMNDMMNSVSVSCYTDDEFIINSVSKGYAGKAVVHNNVAEELVDKIGKLFGWYYRMFVDLTMQNGRLNALLSLYRNDKGIIEDETAIPFSLTVSEVTRNGDNCDVEVIMHMDSERHTFTFENIPIDSGDESGTIHPTEPTE